MDDYINSLNKLLGNDNEIDDLMKKYDAIEEAVNKASVSENHGEDEFKEVEAEQPASDDFKEVEAEQPASDEFKEVEAEQPVSKDDSKDVEDFSEVVFPKDSEPSGSDESDDDFREVVDDLNDFREVESDIKQFMNDAKKAVMLDPMVPAYKPEINLNGTGLVLAGGGGKGIYQVGMLKVLNAAGVLDDVVAISGTSIGAVNTILYAMGVDKMEKVWDEIDMSTLFDFDEKEIASGNTHFSRSEMNTLIEKYLDYNEIRNEKRILYAGTSKCAANFSELDPTYGCTAKYFMFNGATDDEIKSYMLASTALPYIYSPVRIGTDRYLDGGINDNIPIKPLYDLGIRKFVVIELTPISKFNKNDFPGAEFISIVPSHDLGDLFTGTLNFENKDKRFKKELGERDGNVYLKTKFEKDETYIAIEKNLLEMEYNAMVNEHSHMENQIKLENSVSSNLNKFNSIAEKYGSLWDD